MNYCSQCGNQLDRGAHFCSKCGLNLSAGTQPQTSANKPQVEPPSFQYEDGKRHSRILTHHADDPNEEATVDFQDLHPNAVWLFFVSYMGNTSILLLLIVGMAIFNPAVAILLFFLYMILHFIAAFVTYRRYEFQVTPAGFQKTYGIIHRYASSIPYTKIQNVNIRRGLLDRMLGISHVEIETAGSSGESTKNLLGGVLAKSEGYIPGLAVDEAEDLRELMLLRKQNIENSGASRQQTNQHQVAQS